MPLDGRKHPFPKTPNFREEKKEGTVYLGKGVFNDDITIIKRGHAYNSKDSSNLKRVRSQEKLNSPSGKDFTKYFRQHRKENVFGRSFSAALKNVFSDTSLGKKCHRKEPKCSFGPGKKLSSKLERLFHSMNETKSSSKDLSNMNWMSRTSTSTDDFFLFTTSTAASSFSSSSSPSSPSSCASSRSTSRRRQFPSFHRSNSMNNMQVYDNIKEKEIALRYNKNVGTYSLLICLLVMIFCGKVFAIICTSTWFYFAPCCFKHVDSSVEGHNWSQSLDIDSDDNNNNKNVFSVIPQTGPEMIEYTQTLPLFLWGRETDSG
ncbi:hypothetical protein HAX54_012068 [Datura stramonium]|uniref:Uncharacterized protein n=1 Tax=Datura stramonium TaxID=4076 RepID=A0ABS8TL25_DATST|nr:hypothetical protein [Datura stramonium]